MAGRLIATGLATVALIAIVQPMNAARVDVRGITLADTTTPASAGVMRLVDDSLRGRSGKLLAHFLTASRGGSLVPMFRKLFGDSGFAHPGVYQLNAAGATPPFAFISLLPFSEKLDGRVGDYRIGFWPGERRTVSARYANPSGFIKVTQDNVDLRVSEHFRLRDFLTHDQPDVWPKYLVLREDLIDKLELVIAELQRSGVPVSHMAVMSGFRTPQYNADGGTTSGRAKMSRHMYGDASDVFVDNDGDGQMDDLNHDGVVDYRDAQVILAAATRVERSHPELVGGLGVYRATSEHGPFAHIDVRGKTARWGLVK